MYTLSKLSSGSKKPSKAGGIFVFFLSIIISLTIIAAAVKFTLNFKPLYHLDIKLLNIAETSGYGVDEIKANYDALIGYLRTSYKGELNFPTFEMSEQGRIHFVDVKNIFVFLDYLIVVGLFISVVGILISLGKRSFSYLKGSALSLILLPLLLAAPFAVNFDATFTAFHKLFFRNDYWIFDPKTDPVINILPQEFFLHSALLILAIVTLSSGILYMLYKRAAKKNKKDLLYI
jgi:integral membrane protein (TIGR01906 family)